MSTRSQIGLYDGSKETVEYIYCHWDGYLKCVGQRLLGFYNTEQKIRDLLSHGCVSSLQNSPEITCFYSGEPSNTARVTSIENAAKEMADFAIEFIYLYDLAARKWFYVDTSKDISRDGNSVKLHVLRKDNSSFVWDDYTTLRDVENAMDGILDRVNGKFMLKDNDFLPVSLDGMFEHVASIERTSNDVVATTDAGKKVFRSRMPGYDVYKLLRQMEIHEDDAVIEPVSERRLKLCSSFRKKSHRTESFGKMVSGDDIVSKDELAHALCDVIECNANPRDLIGNWSVIVYGDLTSFPVWCYTDDRTGKVMFGISKLKSYIRTIDEDDIDDAISMEHLDDSFTRNEIREIAGDIVDGYLSDENSYDAGFVSPKGMEIELPTTGRDLYNLLQSADEFYADIQEDLTESLTYGICRNLGIGSWQDDRDVIDSLADERVCLRKERRSMKRSRSRR